MTRKECQDAIEAKMKEIVDVYQQYNPDGQYLNLCFTKDTITFNNSYWNQNTSDFDLPIIFGGEYKGGETE